MLSGSQGAAGTYTYFNLCTDLPFYCLLWQNYGTAVQYFPYATPSYPARLALIAAQSLEAVDNPTTPGYLTDPGQWTCDEVNRVGGSQPTGCTSGASPGCTGGGYEYSAQTLGINTSTTAAECIVSTNANGTTSNSIAASHYYVGGSTAPDATGIPCVCDEGESLSVTPNTSSSSMPFGSCTLDT